MFQYKNPLLEIYTRAVAIVTVLTIVVAFVMGVCDLIEWTKPNWTLSSGLHEKYQNNESFTQFGAFYKGSSQEEITKQRVANYEKLLRMEQRNAKLSLIKVFLALVIVGVLNVTVILIHKKVSLKEA